jgi:hypothetical protein
MSTPNFVIHDADHLAVVPDGTIITWERIVGDPTSMAVAFIRRELAHDNDCFEDRCTCTPVVWISPGGWDPQTIAQAGVTFPATVVRWGEVSSTVYTAPELPAVIETLEMGGTYHRASALDAAARVAAGTNQSDEGILATATAFERWLNRDADGTIRTVVDPNDLLGSDCSLGSCATPTDDALRGDQ